MAADAKTGTERPSPDALLMSAVADARELLDHCLKHGKQVDEKHVATVVRASRAVAQGELPEDLEREFLSALSAVAAAAKPASADSLRRGSGGWIWTLRGGTILFVLVAIVVHVFWVVGASLSADVSTRIKEYRDTTQAILDHHRLPIETVSADTERLYFRMRDVGTQLLSETNSLHTWNLVWGRALALVRTVPSFMTAEYQQLSIDGKALVDLANATLAVRALVTFVLPLLYGTLGAFVYVLRESSREISAAVFTHDSASQYVSRLTLGPIAGVVIGFLMTPESGTAIDMGAVRALGTPTLAFLAGYSVEMVFSIMDRLIAVTSRSGPRGEGDKAAPPER
jgi:hypothetical protein